MNPVGVYFSENTGSHTPSSNETLFQQNQILLRELAYVRQEVHSISSQLNRVQRLLLLALILHLWLHFVQW